jgi:hypothetical protein
MNTPLLNSDMRGRAAHGQEYRRTPLIDEGWMVCQYSTCC